MSKRCGECEQTKFALEEDSAEFRIWYEGHQDVCSATHVGSSDAMEVNAAVKLWERSESIGFRYTTLLSDGDSKSFVELKERNVYGNSWCFNQSSLARGKKPGFHKDWVKTPINEEYLPKILPIYQRLASSELLSRCVRGLTQNSNEALHSMIWNRCPKENSASRSRVLIAVSSAISEFNVGTLKNLKTFQDVNCLVTSLSSEHLAFFTDYRRTYFRKKIKSANFKVEQEKIKFAKLRRLKIEKKLGPMYKSGGF
ncbi:uncharacterized protein TNCV_3053041 [Trichonephila clavipes]|uniref:Mutator-like transposase domain-containing protein n=1 Tax=Trichonephila clavipes TaxID=2585209 RepID=A0A8X6V9C0_TRICX|nr:uncharacterized protein TNCV_3053041 [Trichonephila clavipes]